MCARDAILSDLIQRAIGERPSTLTPLHGGCVAQVFKAEFDHHPPVAIKHETGPSPSLDVEGYMLGHLETNTQLPLPEVIHTQPNLLLLGFIENDGVRSAAGEAELADLLAELHSTPAVGDDGQPTFGLKRHTRIGPLAQPNTMADSWASFYRDQRLLAFGRMALDRGVIIQSTFDRLCRLADSLERLLGPTGDDPPVLIHGDLWAGNILWHRGRPEALIDPACYRADREVELAFIDLMGGLSGAFWDRYCDRLPLVAGWEMRRAIYQLYPLLVHAILFDRGGDGEAESGYGDSVRRTLERLPM